MIRLLMVPILCAGFAINVFAQQQGENQKQATPAPNRGELERKFAETMSGASLVGHFTTTGQEKELPKQERYTLGKVSKLQGDLWQFETRIQYGDHDLKVPLAINVFWAGDTPVISLTKLAIPGLGTFTARVLVYDDQYAGTWSAGDHGGHLFGKLERASKNGNSPGKDAKTDNSKPSGKDER